MKGRDLPQEMSEFKVVVIGDSFIGKTSITQRFVERSFKQNNANTIGASFFSKVVKVDNKKEVKLNVWDTGGHEKFKAQQPLYYRDCAAALLTYAVDDLNSFKNVKTWLEELALYVDTSQVALYLVGNKCDLD